MLRTDDNPEGLPIEVFDGIRAGEAADRAQLYRDLADGPFFGNNRNNDISQGVRDAFWLQGMACGHRGAYECIAAFSATDFRPDLAKIDVPTLVIHGDDDQIVPFEVGGKRSAETDRRRRPQGLRRRRARAARHRTRTGSTPTSSSSSTRETKNQETVTATPLPRVWSLEPGLVRASRGRQCRCVCQSAGT